MARYFRTNWIKFLFITFFICSPGLAVVENPDVIIVGAGISGLAAAQELTKNHYQVLVLEARDRIGGRLLSDNRWGSAIDLGGSWLHKTDVNPLMALVKKNEIPVIATHYQLMAPLNKFQSMRIYKDGQPILESKKQAILVLVEKFSRYLDEQMEQFKPATSSLDAVNAFAQREYLSTADKEYLHYFIQDILSFDNGADLRDIDVKNTGNFVSTAQNQEKDVIFARGGYAQLLGILVKNIPILLKQKVTDIDYDENGVVVKTPNATYRAHYALITLPLGVLKANTVHFRPALPAAKKQAIKRLGYGVYNKVYLLFPAPFWDKKSEWLVFLPDANSQSPQEFYEVMNYYKFTQQPILLAFTAGDFSRMTERWTDQEIINHIMRKLRSVYGSAIPDPISYQLTRWGRDPYAQGAYSYRAIGSTDDDVTALATPLLERVFFAGEATSKDDYGTVHGAYSSGILAAQKIMAKQKSAVATP